MYLIISNSSETPIYEQIKNQIKDKIISGELSAGELLPSIRSLAKDLMISVITTKRAYEDLEREGYITMITGKGCFISNKNKELIREEVLKNIENNLNSAINMANKIYLNKEELIEILNLLWEE